ncbi:hypothetical protein FSP39_007468 [Pinctada imbricata]|uniref:Uncharacterized protein n=1 Tax=Pinctada imbricata TaxID=66713 RepID=A0AA88YCZ2_PINIB|nr:hypothetical protein FSP39_007468 [Pinctada imbricata]
MKWFRVVSPLFPFAPGRFAPGRFAPGRFAPKVGRFAPLGGSFRPSRVGRFAPPGWVVSPLKLGRFAPQDGLFNLSSWVVSPHMAGRFAHFFKHTFSEWWVVSPLYTQHLNLYLSKFLTYHSKDQPTTPRINQPYQGVEGGTLSITCASNSTSRPRGQDLTYVWLLNGSSVLPSRFQSSASILTISNLRRTDNSYEIRCNVNETNGLVSNLSSPYRADIHYGPGDSINITWNGAYPLIEDNSQSIPPLMCSAKCNPACTYKWTGPFKGIRNGSLLNFGNVNRNKTGLYKCTATNTILEAERKAYTDFNLSVSYPTSLVTVIPSNQELEINENVNQVLNCNADGYPHPNIKWYKDDKFLTNSYKYTILNANCLSSGNYTCRAENYYGGSNKSISLRSRCSPRLYNDVSSIVIDVADFTQTMTVCMMGYPLPNIRWYYELDGNNHTAGGYKSTIENDTDLLTSSLSVYIYEEYHFGDYFAVATGTSIGKRFILKLNRRPNAPYILQVDCKSNGIANVSWTSAFNGGHQQIFTVLYGLSNDNSRLKTSQRYPDLGEGQIHYIIIPDLLQNQNYEFVVNAENSRGSSTSTTRSKEEGGDSGLPFAAGFGTAGGVAVIISIGVVLLILYRKGGDIHQHQAAAPTAKPQNTQCKNTKQTSTERDAYGTRNVNAQHRNIKQKGLHINQRDQWATGADLGRPSATEIAEGVVILDYVRTTLPLFRLPRGLEERTIVV